MALLDEFRSSPDAERAASSALGEDFLVQLDSRLQLVTRQLAIEAWLSDWSRAAAA